MQHTLNCFEEKMRIVGIVFTRCDSILPGCHTFVFEDVWDMDEIVVGECDERGCGHGKLETSDFVLERSGCSVPFDEYVIGGQIVVSKVGVHMLKRGEGVQHTEDGDSDGLVIDRPPST